MTTEASNAPSVDDVSAEDLFNDIVSGEDSPVDSSDLSDSLGQAEEEPQDEAAEEAPQDDSETPPVESDDDQSNETENVAEEATETQDDPTEDLWAGASEAQRQAYLKLQHESEQLRNDVKANAGRVQGYSRKVNELEKTINQLQQPQPQPQTQTENAIQLDGKSLQEIENDYPEIAQYIRYQTQQIAQQFNQQVEPVRQQTEQLAGSLQELNQRDQQVAINQELQRLYDAHPDYTEIRANGQFQQWLASKPAGIQSLVESYSADDNIELLNLYKLENRPPQQSVAPAQPEVKKDLSEHAEVPRKGAAPPQGLPEDPEELFNLIVSQQ